MVVNMFVYRHPGNGSDVLAIRGRKSIVQKQIEESRVDNTLIAMSVDDGWRISRFVENRPFDYHNLNDAVRAMLLLRDLHQVKPKVRWDNDVMRGTARITKKVPADFYGSIIDKFVEFDAIKEVCLQT